MDFLENEFYKKQNSLKNMAEVLGVGKKFISGNDFYNNYLVTCSVTVDAAQCPTDYCTIDSAVFFQQPCPSDVPCPHDKSHCPQDTTGCEALVDLCLGDFYCEGSRDTSSCWQIFDNCMSPDSTRCNYYLNDISILCWTFDCNGGLDQHIFCGFFVDFWCGSSDVLTCGLVDLLQNL